MTQENHKRFLIEDFFEKLMKKASLSEEEKTLISDELNKEIREKPFRVAVVGQSGVGKSTTLNAVFGLKNYTANIAEGTTKIEEKVFPMRDGFNLSIYDMPGLNNDIDKDEEYEELYKKILPGCDVIVYVVSAHSKDFGEDCRILKEIILPICHLNAIKDNLILAVNKIDTIGESIDPTDPKLQWDVVENKPTQKLSCVIKQKLEDISTKLIDENLVGDAKGLKLHQIVFYSAIFNYNLKDFILAITKAGKRGWIWTSTVGLENVGQANDARIKS